jgi:hypothetical protein
MFLYNNKIPYVLGQKLNSGPNNNDNDNNNENTIAALENKRLHGFYWFGDKDHIVSVLVNKMEINSIDGFRFEYGVQEEDLIHRYHNVASVSTHIRLDGQVTHIVDDKYNDCFTPRWSEFEKFFMYITGWPINTNKLKHNKPKSIWENNNNDDTTSNSSNQ